MEENLKKTLAKLFKKDRTTYEVLMNKINDILTCEGVNHYKNLRKPLQHLKRVHINGPFVLTFKYQEEEDKVVFYDFDHHDYIYK
ncbi:MAG: addiction module toxin RelE [Candidatus Aenigmarchaeota archaeon]|nr:addiction module toxin RelE [Candidatus Aenigmarchaeota archaeon]